MRGSRIELGFADRSALELCVYLADQLPGARLVLRMPTEGEISVPTAYAGPSAAS
jgi:hypothetical protein